MRPAIGALLLCACIAARAGAQDEVPPPSDSAGFSQYSPAACVAAVERVQALSWRAKVDTTPAQQTAQTDTLTDATVHTARACVAHLSITTTTIPRDLISLARVYSAAGNTDAMRAAIDRRLAMDAGKSVVARGETLKDIIAAFVSSRPMMYSAIRPYWTQLVKLGPDAVNSQLEAGVLTAYRISLQKEYDQSSQYAKDVLALVKTLPPAVMLREQDNIKISAGFAYILILNAAEYAGGKDSAKKVVEQMRADVQAFGLGQESAQSVQDIENFYNRYGSPAPLLKGALWYGATEGTRPSLGKVSVILFHTERSNTPMLRRIKAKYGNNVEITIVDATRGYFMNAGPLSPKQEGDTLAYFYQTVLAAPAAVLVNEAPTTRKPDGRIVRGMTENQMAYRGIEMVIIDQEQKIQYASRTASPDEKYVFTVLEKLLDGSATIGTRSVR